MPRLFKDLIVNETDRKARVNLIHRDGTVALHEVSVELASAVAQQGDSWGAKEANLLLKLGDNGVPYPDIDGYYKSSQIDTLLGAKSNNGHSHAAGTLTAGTLPVQVVAANAADYSTSRIRNAQLATAVPSSLPNGAICFVYE